MRSDEAAHVEPMLEFLLDLIEEVALLSLHPPRTEGFSKSQFDS